MLRVPQLWEAEVSRWSSGTAWLAQPDPFLNKDMDKRNQGEYSHKGEGGKDLRHYNFIKI